MKVALVLFLASVMSISAQTTSAGRAVVRANGDGSVSVTPNQARIHIAAVTTAATAQEAASQNASTTAAVISQLTQALGSAGTVQTVSYTVTPNYMYPQGVVTGYTVTNSIEAVLNDLTIAGKIIDTATQAGASRIDSLQFTLQDDSTARGQALRAAVQKAKSKADAMAAALGLHSGAVTVIQESGAVVTPLTATLTSVAATPIVPGPLTVTANVTLEVELTQ